MKLCLGLKLASLALLIVATTTLLPAKPASAAYVDLPAQVPTVKNADSNALDPHQYIHLSTYGNDAGDGDPGAELDSSFLKYYVPDTNKDSNKTFYLNVVDRVRPHKYACDNYKVRWTVTQLDSLETPRGDIAQGEINVNRCAGDTGYSGYSFSFDGGDLLKSSVPSHQSLATALIRFKIIPEPGWGLSPMSSTFSVKASSSGRLGYAAAMLNYGTAFDYLASSKAVNIYPSLSGTSEATSRPGPYGTGPGETPPQHTISQKFGVPCEYTGPGSIIVKFKDADKGTRPPQDDTLKLSVKHYGPSGGYIGTTVYGTSANPVSWDLPGVDGSYGLFAMDVIPKHKYRIDFENVEGGNAIGLYYPFDSGDFNLDCPPPPSAENINCKTYTKTVFRDDPSSTGSSVYRFTVFPKPTNGTNVDGIDGTVAQPVEGLGGIRSTKGDWKTYKTGYVYQSGEIWVTGGSYDHSFDFPPPTAQGWQVYVEKWDHTINRNPTPTSDTIDWYYHATIIQTEDNCYSASCSGLSVIEAPKPPGGDESSVVANKQFSIYGLVNNTGTAWLPVHVFVDGAYSVYGGFQDVGWVYPGAGQPQGVINAPVGAPRDEVASQAITVRIVYGNPANNFTVASCPFIVDTYKEFDIYPTAESMVLNPDNENPSSATFNSLASNTGHPVSATASRSVTKNGGSFASWSTSGNFGVVSYNDTKTIVPPAVIPGDNYCGTIAISPAQGWVGPTKVLVTNPSRSDGPVCSRVTNKPYLKVYGNDVSAGGGFGAACVASTAVGIETYGRNVPGGRAGSGTQLAATALGQINGFASSSVRTPGTPLGLSFANTMNKTGGSSTKPASGGKFGGDPACPTDYYGTTQLPNGNPNKVISSTSPVTVNTLADGKQTLITPTGGTVTLNTGSSFSGRHTVYVDGDVFIKDNITYNAPPGGWGTTSQIPFFTLVAKGNIYISQNVTQLDGLYVAQPRDDMTRGEIYTCRAAGNGSLIASADLWKECGGATNSRQLVINGAFVAKYVHFSRTFKTLRDATAGERYPSNAAEVFRFSPEMYLAEPMFRPRGTSTTGEYDYITTLPPIL